MRSNKLNIYGAVLVFFILCYFSLFHQLGKNPMNMWDEPSYSLNAQEMLERGNPIEIYLLGQPDVYNSKPPFAIWCMAIGIKIFGFNELGARIASAFFAFLSALVLWVIGIKLFKNYWAALTFPLVLLSSCGFVGWHIARTGDTDSFLAFWILLQCVFIFGYTSSESAKKANRYLLLAGLAVSFGCLTKGIAGLTALPGIVVWLIYTRKFKEVFGKKEFYIGLLSFLVLVIGYYWLRSKLTPGYFDAVMNNEIGGRLNRQDFLNHETLPWYFYFENMVKQDRFFVWIYVLPLSIIYILTRPAGRLKSAGIFFIFIFFSISLLLSVSQTKLEWYDAPLYPFMAAIIGISFCLFFNHKGYKYGLLFVCVFSWPYYKVLSNNMKIDEIPSLESFIDEVRKSGHEKDSIHIINADPNFQVFFYAKQDCLKGNYSDVITPTHNSLTTGHYILIEKEARDIEANRAYILRIILRSKHRVCYQIMGKKEAQ